MVDPELKYHLHNGTDSPKISGNDITFSPQTALTAENSTALSSGGAAVLSNSDSAVIENMRTRINEIEARLQSISIIT